MALEDFHPEKDILMEQIEIGPVRIRDVDENNVDFQNLCISIKEDGVTIPVVCNLITDEDGNIKPHKYSMIDGGNRYAGNQKAGNKKITARVAKRLLTPDECRAYQLNLNKNRIKQTKAQEARALGLYLAGNPDVDIKHLAKQFRMSPIEANRIMNLSKLTPDSQKLLDTGKLKVSCAVELGRCNDKKYPGLQANIIKNYLSSSPDEFMDACQKGRAEFKSTGPSGPTGPLPKLRPKNEVEQKWSELQNVIETVDDNAVPIAAMDHFIELKELLDWVLLLDPESLTKREHKRKEKTGLTQIQKERDAALKELADLKKQYEPVMS